MIAKQKPDAEAVIRGGADHPKISGKVLFYKTPRGTLVVTEVAGLPATGENCKSGIFAMHIHEGGNCTTSAAEIFPQVGAHYNPGKCPHPQHAGDLPPLFENRGYAWSAVLTNRFSVGDVMGRTVIIHASPDDFTTQPSGNSGEKIACGVIR
jgi:Cu-Zn family superoxide dismutase